MDRRAFLATTGAVAATAAAPSSMAWAETAARAGAGQGGADAKLRLLLDRFFNEQVDESPEQATSLGLDKGPRAAQKAQLSPRTQAEQQRLLGRAQHRLAELKTVNRAQLSAAGQIDYDVVAYQLTTYVAGGTRFTYGSSGGRFTPYVISQNTGSYQQVPDFLDNQHKVATREDAEAYLSRLSAFRTAMDQELERVRADSARGVIPPDFNIDTAIGQMKALRNKPAANTGLVESLVRKTRDAHVDGDWGGRATRIVETEVFPALDRQIAAMQALRARAVHNAGAWKLPDGEAYYAAALAASTTTTLSPAEVHQMGLDQVRDITGRLDATLKSQGLTKGTVAERLVALNDDPKQLYPDTDEGRTALIDQLNRQIDAVYPLLPRAFRTLPKAKVTVKRVPPDIQDGAANGYYQRAALDGSRPAMYFINLKDVHDWPKFSLPTLTYHEAIPGHHLQISLQQESQEIPMIRRVGGFSAYSEGWALYAEQLADELGVYDQMPLGHAGFLQSFLFRAARLVTDTGIHYKRWSRERATDYMVATTGFARPRTQREVDRYFSWPGQACSYKVGHTVWERLRGQAQAKLGTGFNLGEFHDAGLLAGAMPLTVLETRINSWVAGKMRA